MDFLKSFSVIRFPGSIAAMAHFGEHFEMVYRRRRAITLGEDTILNNLRRKNYIHVNTDKMVAITASGRRYLEEKFGQQADA